MKRLSLRLIANMTGIEPVSWQQQRAQKCIRLHKLICSNMLFIKLADYICQKAEKVWESMPKAMEVWKSGPKAEKVCKKIEKVWQKLRKYVKVWQKLRKYDKVCQKLRKYAKSWDSVSKAEEIFTLAAIFLTFGNHDTSFFRWFGTFILTNFEWRGFGQENQGREGECDDKDGLHFEFEL